MHSIYIQYISHFKLNKLSKAGAALVNTISSYINLVNISLSFFPMQLAEH